MCLAGTLMLGCDEDAITPTRKLRVEAMSHGEFHYRIIRYDERNRISELINGTIDETEDSVESVYHVFYKGNVIERISSEDETHVYEYTYHKGSILESREFVDHHLQVLNEFYYNASGQVDVWVTKQAAGDVLVPLNRRAYRYDASGNAVSMELENYDPLTKGHVLVSTTKFLKFDDKKNSGSLFLNHDNPYHIQFRNNARTWRVENTNGMVGETHFTYEYNAEGYATSQRDLAGALEIKYQFVPY